MKPMRMFLILFVAVALSGCFNLDVDTPDEINIGNVYESPRTDDDDNQGRGIYVPSDSDGGGAETWIDLENDAATHVMLGAEKGVLFYAYDALAYPDKTSDLLARVQDARTLNGVEGVTVTFKFSRKEDEKIGTAVTDERGIASLPVHLLQTGFYLITAKITDVPNDDLAELLEVSETPLLLAARDFDAEFLVVDLDYTVAGSIFANVLLDEAEPRQDAATALNHIVSEKNYTVVYLTQRPQEMTRRFKQWLTDNDFPPGPLLVARLGETDDSDSKQSRLADLRKVFPGVTMGVGDTISDAEACFENDMTAFLLPRYDADDPEDMRDWADDIEDLPDSPRMQVVANWREIETAVFHNLNFPAETYAKRLEQLADEVEHEHRRKNDEDDD